MSNPHITSDLVILGISRDGQTFRPSDWADRLCGAMSMFGQDEKLQYSEHVQPGYRNGVRCVVVGKALADIEPRLFRFFVSFARENELVVTYDADAPASMLPAAQKELSREWTPPSEAH
jgi:Protein of unknown function (DUF3579)